MPLMKRATAELAKHGLPEIEVRRGIYGYYATNKTYRKQTGTLVRKTAKEIVAEVLAGARPQEITK